METGVQELKKVKETLKSYIKEQSEKLVARQVKSMQELRDKHDRDMEEMRAMLLYLQAVVSGQSFQGPSSAPIDRVGRDAGRNLAV